MLPFIHNYNNVMENRIYGIQQTFILKKSQGNCKVFIVCSNIWGISILFFQYKQKLVDDLLKMGNLIYCSQEK